MEDGKTVARDDVSGRARGGHARAEALSPTQRRAIASKAATTRWAASRALRATHKGSFREDFGLDVDCFVLDDPQKTAVISQRGLAIALGIANTSGRSLPRFLAGKKVAPFVGAELGQKLNRPLVFQWSAVVSSGPPAAVYGYDVTILIDICKAIIAADEGGGLMQRQRNVVRQAHVIVNASAKAGIKGLVYALAGYDVTKDEVISAFKLFVREEAREYEKEFPERLYEEWYRLYELKRPARNKPWKFKSLTIDHVYVPLARSNGRILDLTRSQKAQSAERWKKLHQFLSDIGVKALRTHLGQLLGIAQISANREQYEQFFEKIFGKQLALNLGAHAAP